MKYTKHTKGKDWAARKAATCAKVQKLRGTTKYQARQSRNRTEGREFTAETRRSPRNAEKIRHMKA
jgi:hypothetical protein